jgi:V/A-type H+-transporting ATPase subunit D
MARVNVAPTKSSLLRTKERLALAEEGHELLDQKREILVRELMALLKQAQDLEARFEARAETAYQALDRTLGAVGRLGAADLAATAVFAYRWEAGTEAKAGMSFPTLDLELPDPGPLFSGTPGAASADRTSRAFQELLALAVPLAVMRAQVVRLARELKKTQRRVNALEKIVIPQEEETRDFIVTVLEERDREAFFVSKLLKKRVSS